MLAAEANIERLLESLLQLRQSVVGLFSQLPQQLGFNCGRYSTHNSVTALRYPFHLMAAQPLARNLLGPVITDREHLCQRAQRTLPAIIGR
jgi:hypothetical protein